MRLLIDPVRLKRELHFAASWLPSRMYDGAIQLSAPAIGADGRLEIAGANGEVALWASVPTQGVQESGSIPVFAAFLARLLDVLPSGPIELRTEGDKLVVALERQKNRVSRAPLALEIPVLDGRSWVSLVGLSVGKMGAAIGGSVWAAAKPSTGRAAVTSAQLRLSPTGLRIAATDTFRAAIAEKLVGARDSADFLLPAPALAALGSHLGTLSPLATVEVLAGDNGGKVQFRIDGGNDFQSAYVIVTENATFPNIDGVFPSLDAAYDWHFQTERARLLAAIARTGLFAKTARERQPIRLQPIDGDLVLTSAGDAGDIRTVVSGLVTEGQENAPGSSIALDLTFLLDAFSRMPPTTEAWLRVRGPAQAALLGPVAEEGRYLIMPITSKGDE